MKANSPEADPECDDEGIERRARIALAATCEPGEPGLADLLQASSPTNVVATLLSGRPPSIPIPRARAIGARLSDLDLDALMDRTKALGVDVLLPGDPTWPVRMEDLGPRRPLALWAWGEANPRLASVRSIAIVGARACTRYGDQVARDWAAQLSQDSVAIISGGAYGIDASAHRGALAVDGITICVVAGGLDIPYPRGHEGLFADIVDRGLILSEAPLGEVVRRRRFLTRNRLIAALASATCVVEAAHRSGSVSTAYHARDMNRPVLAVPGPVTSETSRGTHRLIRDRVATLAADVEDVRLAIDPIGVAPSEEDAKDDVSTLLREVLDVLPTDRSRHRGLTKQEIAVRSGHRLGLVIELLATAVDKGLAREDREGLWTFSE